MLRDEHPEGWKERRPSYTQDVGVQATLKHQICLGALGPNIPELFSSSADLNHPNYANKGETDAYQPESPEKRCLHLECGST